MEGGGTVMLFLMYAILWIVFTWLTQSIVWGTILSVVLSCVILLLLAMIGGLK